MHDDLPLLRALLDLHPIHDPLVIDKVDEVFEGPSTDYANPVVEPTARNESLVVQNQAGEAADPGLLCESQGCLIRRDHNIGVSIATPSKLNGLQSLPIVPHRHLDVLGIWLHVDHLQGEHVVNIRVLDNLLGG